MDEINRALLDRIEFLENAMRAHLGPKFGATSTNTPHTGVPYLVNGKVPASQLPPSTTTGYYF